MKIPIDIDQTLREAFTRPGRVVVANQSSGEIQIVPKADYAELKQIGWMRIIVCEGCGLYAYPETAFTPDSGMIKPVPARLALPLYGRGDMAYLLCPPPDLSIHPCWDLALFNDECHLTRQQDESVPPSDESSSQ